MLILIRNKGVVGEFEKILYIEKVLCKVVKDYQILYLAHIGKDLGLRKSVKKQATCIWKLIKMIIFIVKVGASGPV